jgi:Zn-dependent peptidase ImmA (M78 family)
LRSNYPTGRRFELARLLGDQLASGHKEPLALVSGAYTYRQKLQRAFAAELLCPFDALDDFLNGDYSESKQEDAAHHFDVSERVVTRQLVNHGRLDSSIPDDSEFDKTAQRRAA